MIERAWPTGLGHLSNMEHCAEIWKKTNRSHYPGTGSEVSLMVWWIQACMGYDLGSYILQFGQQVALRWVQLYVANHLMKHSR